MSSEDWTGECTPNGSQQLMPKVGPNRSVANSRPNVLYVRDYSRKSVPIDRSIIGFTNHRKLGSFRIDRNQCYNDSGCVQNMINEDMDLDLISKMRINLMEGYDMSSLIKDYKSYKTLKWKYFLKWIQNCGCLENRSPESLPHFIAFGGLFTSLMSTPNRIESWTLLVTKFKDSIFMNKIRLNDRFGGRTGQRSDVNPSEQLMDRNAFLAVKFTRIVTQQSQPSAEDVVNEYEKYFSCYETGIGQHRLLLMSEMDAIDVEDNQYEIKCTKHLNFGKKLFNWWSHCAVADINYILIGLKDDNQILQSVSKVAVDELPDRPAFKWNTDESFDFVNRVLDYIRQLVEPANDLDVFKVWYKKNDNCVRSVKLPANYFLPEWFTGRGQTSNEPNP